MNNTNLPTACMISVKFRTLCNFSSSLDTDFKSVGSYKTVAHIPRLHFLEKISMRALFIPLRQLLYIVQNNVGPKP